MEKIWIKKELYFLSYDFLKFLVFFQIFTDFYFNYFLPKITKKAVFIPQTPRS